MLSYPTAIEPAVSHIELASLHFDQWHLTISLRRYEADAVIGMATLTFPWVAGFRYLDESDMLNYPFPENSSKHYVHEIDSGGWLDVERASGNSVSFDQAKEYLVATENECVCVITDTEPVLQRFADRDRAV